MGSVLPRFSPCTLIKFLARAAVSRPSDRCASSESGRRRRGEAAAAAGGVRDVERGGVEHEAWDLCTADAEQAAIFAVAGDGVADGGEMGAELVHAAGFGVSSSSAACGRGGERAVARERRLAGRASISMMSRPRAVGFS